MVELFFVHIPKNYGSSFHHILAHVYGRENVRHVCDFLPWQEDGLTHEIESELFTDHPLVREVIMDIVPHLDVPVLYGHFPLLLLEDVLPGVPRVVWLREPTEHILSRIFHFRKTGLLDAQRTSVESLARHPLFRNHQFFYTGGLLNQFAEVGICERWNRSLQRMARRFGWPADLPVEHRNITDHEEALRAYYRHRPSFLLLLRNINALDYALYDWALRRDDGLGTVG